MVYWTKETFNADRVAGGDILILNGERWVALAETGHNYYDIGDFVNIETGVLCHWSKIPGLYEKEER